MLVNHRRRVTVGIIPGSLLHVTRHRTVARYPAIPVLDGHRAWTDCLYFLVNRHAENLSWPG